MREAENRQGQSLYKNHYRKEPSKDTKRSDGRYGKKQDHLQACTRKTLRSHRETESLCSGHLAPPLLLPSPGDSASSNRDLDSGILRDEDRFQTCAGVRVLSPLLPPPPPGDLLAPASWRVQPDTSPKPQDAGKHRQEQKGTEPMSPAGENQGHVATNRNADAGLDPGPGRGQGGENLGEIQTQPAG